MDHDFFSISVKKEKDLGHLGHDFHTPVFARAATCPRSFKHLGQTGQKKAQKRKIDVHFCHCHFLEIFFLKIKNKKNKKVNFYFVE